MAYKCYRITNLVNGKSYIGKTKQSIEYRFNQHIKASRPSNKHKTTINFAIAKYGKENFSIDILCDNISEEEVSDKEKYYINLYDTYNTGYNETHGGDGGGRLIYNTEIIIGILEGYCSDVGLNDLCVKYNMKYNAVFDITRLKFSDHHKIDQNLIEKVRLAKLSSKKRKKVSEKDVVDIIIDFTDGKRITKIAHERGLSISNTFSIIWRDTFCDVELQQELSDKLKVALDNRCKNSKRKHFCKTFMSRSLM